MQNSFCSNKLNLISCTFEPDAVRATGRFPDARRRRRVRFRAGELHLLCSSVGSCGFKQTHLTLQRKTFLLRFSDYPQNTKCATHRLHPRLCQKLPPSCQLMKPHSKAGNVTAPSHEKKPKKILLHKVTTECFLFKLQTLKLEENARSLVASERS